MLNEHAPDAPSYISLWTENERLKLRVAELEARVDAFEPDAMYTENQRLRMKLAEERAEHERAMLTAANWVPDVRERERIRKT